MKKLISFSFALLFSHAITAQEQPPQTKQLSPDETIQLFKDNSDKLDTIAITIVVQRDSQNYDKAKWEKLVERSSTTLVRSQNHDWVEKYNELIRDMQETCSEDCGITGGAQIQFGNQEQARAQQQAQAQSAQTENSK